MANPPISRIEFTSTAIVLVADKSKFTFPYASSNAPALSLSALDVQALLADVKANNEATLAKLRDDFVAALTEAGPILTAGGGGTSPAPGSAAGVDVPAVVETAMTPASMTVLVGPGRAIKEIADAIPLMKDSGEIVLDDATYLTPFHSGVWDLRIRSASGNPFKCRMDVRGGNGGGVRLAYEKAAMHLGAQTTIIGVGVVNAGSLTSGKNWSNEAAFYAEEFARPGFLKLVRCAVDNSGNGVFIPANRSISGNITYIERECIFGYFKPNSQSNPANSGPSHDRYIGPPVVDIDGSMDFGCTNGHSLKCGADTTRVANCYMASLGGRAIELPYGGVGLILNSTIVSRDDGNANFVGFADEATRLAGKATLTFDGGRMLLGRAPSVMFIGDGATVIILPSVQVGTFGGSLETNGGGTLIGAPAGTPSVAKPARPALPAWATT